MRVYDQNLTGAAAAQTGGAQEVAGAGRSEGARTQRTSPEGDRIELSNTLSALSRALSTHESGRAARVEELAAQYARGEYRADAGATSRAMISDAVASAAG